MKRCLALLTPILVLLLLLLLLPATAVAAPNATAKFDRAIDRLVAKGYPQALEAYFTSLGTNPDLGFRWAGTSAERAVSMKVKKTLQACGLYGVNLERVPVDVFEFESASVTVGDRVMTASAFAGIPPTAPGGIEAEVVYVGSGSAAEFDAAGDVSGKLVICDLAMTDWWFNWPGAEAAMRGAAGVILTYGTDDSYYSHSPDALGSFDATYQFDWAPMVYISKSDGDWLKAELAEATTGGQALNAKMVYKARVKLADDGGYGYNVIATLRGRVRDGQKTVFVAHQDAHFRAGMDDTAALVNMLTIAKAMRISGYHPQHDVVFLATTGEEFGYTNCYYDWLTGAWWAATQSHRDWAGKVRAVLNLELMGLKDAPLGGPCSEELQSWLTALAADNGD
ncbi:MAG TPA: M28 family peptidase, partial [Thermoleophilia bacterium]|nr:M28 family peptidase [Thermoleophilia bacterium]